MVDLEPKKIKAFQMDMLQYFADVHPEIMEELQEKKVLTDEMTDKIVAAARNLKRAGVRMANVKEIQDRMKSIRDTMKITNAMYMISSSKMKRAKKALADTEPYFFGMQAAISRILRHVPDIEHKFFDSERKKEVKKSERKIGHIVVTADKGLAGAYNHNVIKMAEEQLQEEGRHTLYVLGELGRQYFSKKENRRRGSGSGFPFYCSETYDAQSQNDRAQNGG